MRKLRFQYVSDLHLEIWPKTTPFNQFVGLTKYSKNTQLILAGDITTFKCERTIPFLKWCSNNFENVFYVSGNHEYYSRSENTIEEGINLKKTICKNVGENVHALDDEVYELNGDTVVIGSTMWSYIPYPIEHIASQKINDYYQIKDFTVTYQNELHEKSKQFIEESLRKYTDKKKVVITHHAPSENNTISQKYQGSELNPVFAVNVENIAECADYWVFGHTHFTTKFKIGNCQVMSNAKGYNQESDKNFNPNEYFEI